MTTGDIVWPHKHGSAAHVRALQEEIQRLTTANAEDRAARQAKAEEMVALMASMTDAQVRTKRALAQAEHTLNRIYIRDCLDPSETAREGLREIERRREGKG